MNYQYRKDYRTNNQFAQEIADSTKKEFYLVHRWQLEMQLQGKKWAVVPYGIDSFGKVNLKKQDGKPDFLLLKKNESMISDYGDDKLFFQEEFLEIKNTPVLDKVTFKLQSVENIIKIQYQANVLLFLNTGQIKKHSIKEMDLSKAYWSLIDFMQMKSIYNDYKDKVFRWKPFGNKKVIQLRQEDYSKYFKLERFRFKL